MDHKTLLFALLEARGETPPGEDHAFESAESSDGEGGCATPTSTARGAPNEEEAAALAARLGALDAALFRGLSEARVARVVRNAFLTQAQPGETILHQGGEGRELFLVLTGAVDVQRRVADEPRTLLTLLPGQIFGELAFLANLPRTADVVATSETQLLLLSREGFLGVLAAAPDDALILLINLALILCERLAVSTNVQTDVLTAAERLKTQQEIDRRRTLSQMVAGVAHEINTPLGIANHAASIVTELARDLARAPLPDASRETLDDMLAAARLMMENIARADRLVQTFKTLSVNQAVDTLDDVNLVQLTQDTVDLYRLKARASKLAVSVLDRLGDHGDEWRGYPGHYAQIILNLLTNVDRYAYPDDQGGKVEIEIGLDHNAGRSDRYAVIVRDFGRGVAPENLERIFEPFYTTGRGKGGTGLGLPIVKNLVTESLQGEIDVDSRPGAGLDVRMRLPLKVATTPHAN